jgi:palmitoyltransferase
VSTGTAIIVLQHLLLLPVIVSWSRFFYALVVNSGALPLGEKIEVPAGPVENSDIQKPQDSLNLSKRPVTANGSGVPKGQSANEVSKTTEEQRANEASETTGEQRVESLDTSNTVVAPNMGLDRQAMLKGMLTPPPGLEEFHTKDFFICGYDGLPNYCNTCRTWKPDRVHHCSELNRCFRLYDHFCPWVGGPITEMTYKFFIQFTFYAFFYCVYIFVVMIWALRAKLHDVRFLEFRSVQHGVLTIMTLVPDL